MATFSLAKQGDVDVVAGLKVKDFKRLDTYLIPVNTVTRMVDYKSKKGRKLTVTEKAALDKVTIHNNLILLISAIASYFPQYKVELTDHGGERNEVTVDKQLISLNKAVGGANGSQHKRSTACDFKLRHRETGKCMDTAMLIVMSEYIANKIGLRGGFGIYAGAWDYVHIDVRGSFVAWFESYDGNGLGTQGGRKITFRYNKSKDRDKWQRAAGIRLIQRALKKLGYDISEDGVFGPQTDAVVRDYQAKNHLKSDGLPGLQTLRELNKSVGYTVLPWAA